MDRQTLLQLAEQSKIAIDDSEVDALAQELGRLLAHFDALAEVDTDGVEPSPYPQPLALATRPDEPGAALDPDRVTANAGATRAQQFMVPRVVEGG